VNGIERADVLLIGGGVASVRCARTLRRHGFAGSIVLVGAEARPPYNRPPLSKELLRDDLDDDLVLAEPLGWYERRSIDLRLGTAVVALDPDERLARLDDGRAIAFDRCLIATGAEPRTLPVEGAEHALLLRTLVDARRLRAAAVGLGAGARATVIGGGFIGVEVASGLAALGLDVSIVEMGPELWGATLGRELGAWARTRLQEQGITVNLGQAVTHVAATSVRTDTIELSHRLVVAGIGVLPRVELAAAAGLAIDDGIVADVGGRTSAPSIWAAGDVARVDGRRVEHWHSAREGGERAAVSMLELPVPPRPPSWVFTEVGGTTLDVIGDAASWDEARWVADGSVLAYLAVDRVVQLAIVNAALDPDAARQLVAAGATVEAVEGSLAGRHSR
jgi:3-phenylpropionate/trans-cinnamate dioxygenase ferredoxin reductase subunit